MPSRPLISVVIPVYGVADYLSACLDSVLGGAPDGLEVIAVDDASPDGCGALLDARAAADPRLRVVHLTSNAGPGHARNVGVELATGEYVWFIDGDDQAADGALAAITRRLAPAADGRPGPDLLLIDWVNSYPDGRTEPSPGRKLFAQVPPGEITLSQQPRLVELTMTAWSKLLRREFLAGLGVDFAAGIHEDVVVTSAALLQARSIAVLDAVCYRYRRDRPGSFMVTSGTAQLAIFPAYDRVFGLIAAQQAAGTEVSAAVQAAFFERAIWHYSTILTGGPGRPGLVPRDQRRAFFARMHADFLARRPPGYRPPPGARGLKFRLIELGNYRLYAALEPVNDLRLAARRISGSLSTRRRPRSS